MTVLSGGDERALVPVAAGWERPSELAGGEEHNS
jgi:hypothetical protein